MSNQFRYVDALNTIRFIAVSPTFYIAIYLLKSAAVILLAGLSCKYFEMPVIKLKEKFNCI